MKVLYVAREIPKPDAYKLSNFLPRMQCMPCTLLHATNSREAEQYAPEADAICLSTFSTNRWVSEGSLIYKASVPVGRFYLDVWKIPPLKKLPPEYRNPRGTLISDFFRDYDMRISPCKELFAKACPEWKATMFWSPHSVDVQDFDVSRDIDVLFWGRTDEGGGYGNRARIAVLLGSRVVSGRGVDGLYTHDMVFGKRRFKYVLINPRSKLYYGPALYRLLSRTRICCTAPPNCAAPVGKFFENAACGSVSLTTDFTDKEALGFEHKKNIWITSLDQYLKDLEFLLTNPDLVDEMSKNAKELIRTRHTPAIRGKELYDHLCKVTGVE